MTYYSRMLATPERSLPLERNAIRAWLGRRRWTHFVTLALNEPYVSIGRVRDRLYRWDARMNDALIGGGWQKRPDERMQWFAFVEKLEPNPHWHLCVEVIPHQITRLKAKDPISPSPLSDAVGAIWKKFVPSGTTDVQLYGDAGAVNYMTKGLHRPENYVYFIFSLEFIRR